MNEARDLMNTIALNTINESILHCRFAKVCPTLGCKKHWVNGGKELFVNPSPGFFGRYFDPAQDILFIAQNPGKPVKSRVDEEQYAEGLALEERMQKYGETLKSYYATSNIARMLKISWEHMAWTNVVKCPTIDNRMITNKEFGLCSPYLKKQLDIISPALIVTIGHWASSFITGSNTSYGLSIQLNRSVVSMAHYSRADLTDWLGTLSQQVHKAKMTKPWGR